MVGHLKGDPGLDTYSILQFHVKEVIWVRIPAAAPINGSLAQLVE